MVQQQEQELEIDSSFESQEDVRILFVGDQGVGKTSIIYSLVNDDFDPNVPARMANITVPAEVTPENVTINIVDYSDREQTLDDFREAVQEANVICIVFQAGYDESLDRVKTHWIPTIRKYQIQTTDIYKPIILVANKIDLIQDDYDKPLDWRVASVIQEFIDVEAYIETSARIQKNIVELFSAAQKAIVYPLAPLFDPQLRILTSKCRSALINIFALCDLDGDGLLSDHELNLFQENCFGTPLQKDALDDLKLIIKQSTVDGIREYGMTQTGFLFLHTLSIDKGRHDFTWQVLRKFKYDIHLNSSNNNNNLLSGSSKLAVDSTGEFSHRNSSFSSSHGSGEDDGHDMNQLKTNSDISDNDDEEEDISENLNHLDLTWISEHSNMIKASLGLTLATLISMLAFRFLVQSGPKG